MMGTVLKLAAAAAVLYYLETRGAKNPCAGREDYTPCGSPNRKCLKGKCVEFVRCADDPVCSKASVEFVDVDATDDVDPFGWLSPETWMDPEAWFQRAGDIIDNTGAIISTLDPRLDQ